MATQHLEKNILDKVGKYNLSELSIISYRQDKEESAPKFIDIKGITLTMSITEDIFTNSIIGSCTVYDHLKYIITKFLRSAKHMKVR